MRMFATLLDNGMFFNIYEHRQATAMCCDSDEKIYEVEVVEKENGQYWGWKKENDISMIWPSYAQLCICFPYGIKAAIDHGDGKPVRLAITAV